MFSGTPQITKKIKMSPEPLISIQYICLGSVFSIHSAKSTSHDQEVVLSMEKKAFPFATLVYQRVEGLKEMVHPPSQDSQDTCSFVDSLAWFGWVVCLKSCGKFHRNLPRTLPQSWFAVRDCQDHMNHTFFATGMGWEERCLGVQWSLSSTHIVTT